VTFYFCGLAAMALLAYGGGLLLRQSMTCSLFVRLVWLHRYWLTQYIQLARKMTLSFPTWLLSVAWLMLSPREILNIASVCEMWCCWYVCVKYIFNFKTSDRVRARHVCAVYKVISFERIVKLCVGLTKDVVRM